MCSSLCHSTAGKPTRDLSHLCCEIQACLPCVQALQTNQPPVCSPLRGSSAFAKLTCLPFLTFVKTFFCLCACEYSISYSRAEPSRLASPLHSPPPKTSQCQTPPEPILSSATVSWTASRLRTDVSLHPQEALKQSASYSACGMGLMHVGSLTT